MSEIQRYEVDGFGDVLPNQSSGKWVRFTDHEAAIEQVLADAKARIGRLAAPNGSYGEAEWGFLRGVTAALAALTQPQAEQWHENDEADKAATAAGVADADPVARITKKVNESLGAELADACDHIRALIGGDVGAILYAREWLEEHDHEEREPGPYAKAFRERVCPVPEFPGIRNQQEREA